jgi:hypothetical protein
MTAALTIDVEQCRDSDLVGVKAARLAQARAVGFPVPDSLAVPCAVSTRALAAAVGAEIGPRLHAARLEVMSADQADLHWLVSLSRTLGPTLAVRSSSPLEGDPRLAGAFSSLIGVTPEEVPTAVLAVWASAIRAPGPAPRMGVLIQPELVPVSAGTAELIADGSVEVVATDGPAAALTAGWVSGVTVAVSLSGDIEPTAATLPVTKSVLRVVAGLTRDVAAALGDDLIEWAFADDRLWLVQSRKAERAVAPRRRPMPAQSALQRPTSAVSARSTAARQAPGDLDQAVASPFIDPRLVLRAVRCAGDLAERWVLPWAVAWAGRPPASETPEPRLEPDPSATWTLMTKLSEQLTAEVWGVRTDQVDRVAADLGPLRRGHVSSFDTDLMALPAPDQLLALRCLQLCARLTSHLIARRVISSAAQFWALPSDIGSLLRGGPEPADLHRRPHLAALRWESLLDSAVVTGQRFGGTAASTGTGCGLAVLAGEAAILAADRAGGLPGRPVIVMRYPLPQYSPLLMGAAGLVSHGGSAAAHLMAVARSLGVPAVIGCDLLAEVGQGSGAYVAVDGWSGSVSVLAAN